MAVSTYPWIILILLTILRDQVQGVPCGYPGSSQNGRPNRVQEYYSEGQAVTYSCDQGYFLMGPSSRKCTDNGTWTPARIPLCDSRLGGLEESGTAESSQPLHEYPARLAIDGDATTCSYAGRTPPRWWRLDLGRSYRILSIALTVADPQSEQNLAVFILGLNGNSAIYQRCASFSGKFASTSVVLPCGGGGASSEGGLVGRYLHIEDIRKDLNYFGVCEVDVLVLRDRYECGQPERPVNSYTVRLKPDQVEYRCVAGHRLVGNRRRQCLTNGQWSGNQPLCVEVRCPPPENITNGSVRIRSTAYPAGGQQAVLGTLAVYTCDQGFTLKAAAGSGTNGSRICNEDGEWSPSQPPLCEPVDCGRPFVPAFFPEGTTLKLLNGTLTGHGTMARLRCPEGYEPSSGHDDLLRCKGDGIWTKPKIKCLSGLHVASSPVEAAREEPGEAVTLGLVLGLVGTILLLTMVLAVLCIILRRSRPSGVSAPSPEAPQESEGTHKTETERVTKVDQATETDCDKCRSKTECEQRTAQDRWRKGILSAMGTETERKPFAGCEAIPEENITEVENDKQRTGANRMLETDLDCDDNETDKTEATEMPLDETLCDEMESGTRSELMNETETGENKTEHLNGIWDTTETDDITEEEHKPGSKDESGTTKAEMETEGTETEMESVSELESEGETELENETEHETESEAESVGDEGQTNIQTSP